MKSQSLSFRWLLILLLFMSACTADPKEMIARKWRPVDASGENITNDVRKNIVKEGNVLQFTETGTFTSYTEGDEPEQGTYTFNEGAKSINLTRADGYQTQMKVLELHHSKLVLQTNGVTIVLEPIK